MPERNARATFGRTLLLGLAGGALTAVAAAKSWASLGGQATRSPGVMVDHQQLATAGEVPLASALSLVALAAWGAVLVTRGTFRRVVAAIGLLAAVGVLVVGIRSAWAAPHAVLRAAHQQAAIGTADASLTGWYWVALAGSVLLVLSLLVAVRDAVAWPAMGTRYDAPAAQSAPARPQSNLDMWKALDEGRDPTD